MHKLLDYVPVDRRHALVAGLDLPERAQGAALFADISGFTPATEALARSFGPRRGAEELLALLNSIYEALIGAVDRYGGSVIGFAGDAITCWFDERAPAGEAGGPPAARRAAACALELQAAIAPYRAVAVPGGPALALALKTSVVAGPARRLLVGDPRIQLIEVLAGATIARLGAVAAQTGSGETLVDAPCAEALGADADLGEWRHGEAARCVALRGLRAPAAARPWPALEPARFDAEQLRPWMLPPVFQRLQSGQGEFLAELRHTVSLFLRFADLAYDSDPTAGAQLDAFVRWVQQLLARHDGWLIQLSMGDKGSYLYATFGAPIAHGDDATRAVSAALALRAPPAALAHLGPVQIGLSAGQSRVGAMGAGTRTYNVLGDATNVAARLMELAAPGAVLMSASLAPLVGRRFLIEPMPPRSLKGKAEQIIPLAVHGIMPVGGLQLEEPQHATPLVGREPELAFADERLALAASGHGQAVAIVGDAGIGKSRLAAELIARAQRGGFVAYAGPAQSTNRQTPYHAWRPIWRAFFSLDPLAAPEEQAAALARELAALDPALSPRLPLLGLPLGLPLPETSLTAALAGQARKESLEQLLIGCLRARLADGPPLLLALEDAHWLDDLSRDLLAAVARAIFAMPVLLLVVHRPPEPAESAPLQAGQLPHGATLALDALGAEEASRLAEQRALAMLGGEIGVSPALVAAVVRRAEGNPFYIEELINYLRDRGLAADAASLEALELPGSLSSLILSRIDQLPAAQQTTLKVASVVGRAFAVDWLWGSYPALGARSQVCDDLSLLARLDITPLDTPEPELRYSFKHATSQEVVYESIPFAQRARLHDQLAAWLETRPGGAPIDLLAFHYGRGDNPERQRHYFRAAGEAAAARFDNRAAARYYERLLPLLPDDEQAPALLALANVLNALSAHGDARARATRALELAAGPEAEQQRALARLVIGQTYIARWRGDEATPWLEAAREQFAALGNEAGVTRTTLRLASALWQRGELDRAAALLDALSAALERRGERAALADALFNLGNIASSRPDFVVAGGYWRRSLELFRELGDRHRMALATCNVALGELQTGNVAECERLCHEALPTIHEVGARREYGQAHGILALAALRRGDPAAAWSLLLTNLDIYRDLGALPEFGVSLIGLAECLIAAGPAGALRAATLAGMGARLHELGGAAVLPFNRVRLDRLLAGARAAAGDERAAAVHAAGLAADWPEAIRYVQRLGAEAPAYL